MLDVFSRFYQLLLLLVQMGLSFFLGVVLWKERQERYDTMDY